MAVLVEGISVIVRRDAVARRYKGGWPSFVSDAVNSTLCADSEIARLGFMHPDDVGAFIGRLQVHGFVFLDQAGAAVDIVVVDQREGPTTACKWIEFFGQDVPGGRVSAARLVGSREQGLICPDGWTFEHSLSKSFEFHPGRKLNDNYEFVRHEHGTDVFRDRRTNKEVYITRPMSLAASDEEDAGGDIEALRREHNSLLEQAWKLLEPYFGHEAPPTSVADTAKIVRACTALERATSIRKENWNAWWGLGMARRLLGDREGAYAAFKSAYGINPNEIEVGRNLGEECIALGYATEALEVTAAIMRIDPKNAGLIANHALARLIGGDVKGALNEADRALGVDPKDDVTKSLRRYIEEVRIGRRALPSKLAT